MVAQIHDGTAPCLHTNHKVISRWDRYLEKALKGTQKYVIRQEVYTYPCRIRADGAEVANRMLSRRHTIPCLSLRDWSFRILERLREERRQACPRKVRDRSGRRCSAAISLGLPSNRTPYLSRPILQIKRISNTNFVVSLADVLSRRRVLSKRPKIVVSKNHDVTDKPSIDLQGRCGYLTTPSSLHSGLAIFNE